MSKKQRRRVKQTQKQSEQLIQAEAVSPQKTFDKRFYYLILFIVGFLLYANTIPNEFAVDDSIVVSENQFTRKGFAGLKDIFTTDAFEGFFGERGAKLVAGGRYRPFSIAMFAVEKEIFGGKEYNSHIGHAVNAILYGLTGILLFAFLSQLIPLKPTSHAIFNLPLIISVLFIFHPIHTEAVANIKGRDEVLVFLFSMLTLFFIIKYIDKKAAYFIPLALLFFALGLLSKENAITFIAIIPLTIFFFRKKVALSKYVAVTLSLIAVTGIYLYVRSLYTESSITDTSMEILNNPFVHATTAERFATVLTTFMHYLRLLIVPHPLSHDYYFNQIPIVGFSDLLAITSLLFHVGLMLFTIYRVIKGDRKLWIYGVFFYFISFSIVSNILFTVGVTMSERFIYVSSFGFSIVSGYLIYRLYLKSGKIAMGVLGVLLALYGFKTVERNMDWKNNFVLFTHDVDISTNSAKLQTAAGGELIAEADRTEDKKVRQTYLERSTVHLKKALEIYPQHSNAWLLLGNATFKLSDNPLDAQEYYQTALKYRRGYYDAFFNLGVIMSETKNYRQAKKYYKKAIKARPENLAPVNNLADTYFNLNKPDSSIIYYKKVAEMDPNNASTWNRIGIIYGQKLNDLPTAVNYLQKALTMQANSVKFQEDLGVAYGFMGEYEKAEEIFKKIIEQHPNYASAHFNLSVTLKNMGKDAESRMHLEKARELDPVYGNYEGF